MQPGQVIPADGIPNEILEGICIPTPGEDDFALKAEAATIVMMYAQTVMPHQDKYWQILAVEESFYAPQTTPKGRPYTIEMHTDLIVRNTQTGQFFVIDHKSGTIWSQEQAEWDPQMALYVAVLHANGYPIEAGVFNFLGTRINKRSPTDWAKNFARRRVKKTKEASRNALRTFGAHVDRIIDQETPEPGQITYPMKQTKQCAFCSFNSVCEARLQGNMPLARNLLDRIETREHSGSKRDEEKRDFLLQVEARQAGSPYGEPDLDTVTLIGS